MSKSSDRRRSAKPRYCVRCHQKKEPEEFPWGDTTRTGRKPYRKKLSQGRYRRRSTVCQACWDLEDAEMKARRASWEKNGVRYRRCADCRFVGIEAENFYMAGAHRSCYCKRCHARRGAERYRRQVSTPEGRARRREQNRAANRRWRARHPEKVREYARRYGQEVKADPERYQALLETRRIYHRLRRERLGLGVRPPREKSLPQPRESRTALPLALALEQYRTHHGQNHREVCKRAGISPRTLNRWLHEEVQVPAPIADRVLVRMGWNDWDIWNDETRAAA